MAGQDAPPLRRIKMKAVNFIVAVIFVFSAILAQIVGSEGLKIIYAISTVISGIYLILVAVSFLRDSIGE